MLTSHKVFSQAELKSRYEIQMDNYCKTVNIEGLTMVDMAKKEIIPAVCEYVTDLSEGLAAKKAAVPSLKCAYESKQITRLSALTDQMDEAADDLQDALIKLKAITDVTEAANNIRDVILPKMAVLRVACDEAETLTGEDYWPFPTYDKLLFGVR